jgi:hypothetical protein
MQKLFWGSLLTVATAACVHAEKSDEGKRFLAEAKPVEVTVGTDADDLGAQITMQKQEMTEVSDLSTEPPILVYFDYSKQGIAKRQEINSTKWNDGKEGFNEATREEYLRKMYFSNSRNLSVAGQRQSACFYGMANNVSEAFFTSREAGDIQNVSTGHVETKASSDGRMLAIRFEHEDLGTQSFRLLHCNAGKGTIADYVGPVTDPSAYTVYKKPARMIASVSVNMVNVGNGFEPRSFDRNFGFAMLDKTEDPQVKSRFVLRADYDVAKLQKEERPWKGLNLRNQKEALKFALMVQAHFYENMANQSPKPDENFIAQKNKDRYWCHMPWMHTGLNGREAIHGMTQERDLRSAPLIPAFASTSPGSNWGIAYFNSSGCQTINDVFGSANNPKQNPAFEKAQFKDGTMIAKMLFTTAKFQEIKNAFQWNANVSEPGSSVRRIKPVRHIQMDISVRDSELVGVNPDLSSWAMVGFYYDPNYDFDKELKEFVGMENPLKAIKGLPKAFLKMRPMGVQTGFDSPSTGDTVLFPGAFANGTGHRLNGPAENSKSSCMGCHATAGTTASAVPGFLSGVMFRPFVGKPEVNFSQQMALAQANFETQMQ